LEDVTNASGFWTAVRGQTWWTETSDGMDRPDELPSGPNRELDRPARVVQPKPTRSDRPVHDNTNGGDADDGGRRRLPD